MMCLLTNRSAARSAARAEFKIDVQNACPPTASTLPLNWQDYGGSRWQLSNETTSIDHARERGSHDRPKRVLCYVCNWRRLTLHTPTIRWSNNLIGRGQQRFRDGDAEGFGGLEVDDQ
jgi:hypothetical protein